MPAPVVGARGPDTLKNLAALAPLGQIVYLVDRRVGRQERFVSCAGIIR